MKAIFFDSDGVLVDTERLFFEVTRAAFESAGVALSSAQWARGYLGEGRRSRDIAGQLGMEPGRIADVIRQRDEAFWIRIDRGVPVFPGVAETLGRLARQFRLAVVTGASRPHFERVHSATGLRDFFETVVTCDDYERAKPDPQAYLTALDKLGLDAGECLAVEDSPRGAKAAVSAGLRCVVIPTSLTDGTLCPAECIFVDNVTRLPGLIATGSDFFRL